MMPSFDLSIGKALVSVLEDIDKAPDGVGFFVVRGVRVRHVGCLLDQPKVADIVIELEAILCRDHEAADVAAVLHRCSIAITPGQYKRDGAVFDVFSEWKGGFSNRGAVYLAIGHQHDEAVVEPTEWPKNLHQSLRALVEMELP